MRHFVHELNPDALLTHRDFVRSLAHSLIFDRHLAEDVAQDSFIAAWSDKPKGVRLRAWLRTIVQNASKQYWRSEARRRHREQSAAKAERTPSTADILEREELRKTVVEAVLALAEPYKSVVVLRYFESLPQREIARRLQVPVETVHTQLRRALHSLRKSLQARHNDRGETLYSLLLPLAGTVTMKTTSKIGIVVIVLLLLGLALLLTTLSTTQDSGDAKIDATEGRASATADHGSASRATTDVPPRDESTVPTRSSIGGRVVDSNMKPVRGALVTACASDLPFAPNTSNLTDDRVKGVTTASDVEGKFSLPVDEAFPRFALTADYPGLAPCIVDSVRAGTRDLLIVLRTANRFEGFVRDLDERPIPGATVTWTGLRAGMVMTRSTVSGADGSYALADLPRPSEMTVDRTASEYICASADDFADSRTRFIRRRPDIDGKEVCNIYLTRGATLSGRVVDAETGAPISGATVYVQAPNDNERVNRTHALDISYPTPPFLFGAAKSLADGQFTIPRIPSWGVSPYYPTFKDSKNVEQRALGQIAAFAPGYSIAVEQVRVPREGETLSFELKCLPSATVQGRVMDTNGHSVEGVLVSAEVPSLNWYTRGPWEISERTLQFVSRELRTGADGKYRIEVAARRNDPTEVMMNSFWPTTHNHQKSGKITCAVTAGRTIDAPDLVLMPQQTGAARIRVVDTVGKPIFGAAVYSSPNWPNTHLISDRDGYVQYLTWGRTPHPRPERVTVRCEGYATKESGEFLPSLTNIPDVTVVLSPEKVVSGTVTFESGMPADSVFVGAALASESPDLLVGNTQDPNWPVNDISRRRWITTTRSRPDGSFDIKGLPDGPFHIAAFFSIPSPSRTLTSEIYALKQHVVAGENKLLLQLPALPRANDPAWGSSIDVHVVEHKTGKPVTAAQVILTSSSMARYGEPVGVGIFRVHHIPKGHWFANVDCQDFAYASVPIYATGVGPGKIEIRVHPAVTWRGTVRTDDGRLLRNTRFQLHFQSGVGGKMSLEMESNDDAEFVVEGASVNTVYDVYSNGASRRTKKEDSSAFAGLWIRPLEPKIILPAGELNVTQDITLVEGGIISIRVFCTKLIERSASLWDPDKEQTTANSKIEVLDPSGKCIYTKFGILNHDSKSIFLPIGDYTIRMSGPNFETREERVSLTKTERSSGVVFDIK